MARVWFNKTFSSVHNALRLIRHADPLQQYVLLASSPNSNILVSSVADEYYAEPSDTQDYVAWCLDFCQTNHVDIFVPGKHALQLAEHVQQFLDIGVRVLSAGSAYNLTQVDNKANFYAQIPLDLAPAFKVASTYTEFESAYASLSLQHTDICIKPAVSVYGLGFKLIKPNASAYDIYTTGSPYQIDLGSLRLMLEQQQNFAPLLVMEYLPGSEYSVDCLADSGTLKCAVARRKPLQSGQAQRIDDSADIQQACAQLIKQFALNGFINVQFKQGVHGLRVLEINPRMSGGIAMSCMAGPNLPYLGLKGFDLGYGNVDIPNILAGAGVAEANLAFLHNN